MPVADAHIHLFERGFAGVTGGPPAGADELELYERLRERHRIERSLVVGYEGETRYAGNNEYVLRLAAARPWIAPVVFVPAAPAPDAEAFRTLRARGAVGLALYAPGEAEAQAIAGWPASVLDALLAQRFLLSFNARPAAIASLAGFVERLEGCRVLFSHLGLPGRQDVPAVESARTQLAPLLALSRLPRVMVKFSAPYAISDPAHDFPHRAAGPFVDVLLDAFGPGRLLWGSDFSPALDHVSFAQALDTRLLAGCTPGEVEGVLGGNLLRLLADHRGGN